jgi:hypothetical protein
LIGTRGNDENFFDVNGDGFVSPVDAIIVINALPSAAPQAPLSGQATAAAFDEQSTAPVNLVIPAGSLSDDNEEDEVSTNRRRWSLDSVIDEMADEVAAQWNQ